MTGPTQDFAVRETIIKGTTYMVSFPRPLSFPTPIRPCKINPTFPRMCMSFSGTFTCAKSSIPRFPNNLIRKCHISPPPPTWGAVRSHLVRCRAVMLINLHFLATRKFPSMGRNVNFFLPSWVLAIFHTSFWGK